MWVTWLHEFDFTDGAYPWFGDLTIDSQGNLYGTTLDGGSYGEGAVYKLTSSNGGWTYQVLYNFPCCGAVGAFPMSGVTLNAAGNLYGTTSAGGLAGSCGGVGCGVLWEITP